MIIKLEILLKKIFVSNFYFFFMNVMGKESVMMLVMVCLIMVKLIYANLEGGIICICLLSLFIYFLLHLILDLFDIFQF